MSLCTLCSVGTMDLRIFGNMRMKAGHSGFDVPGLAHCSLSISYCQDILERHPNWTNKRDKVMSRLCLNYSSPENWDTEKLTMKDVNIFEVWSTGRLNAEVFFKSTKNYPLEKCDFSALSNSTGRQITFLKPKGMKVGLNRLDWSLDEYDDVEDIDEVQEDEGDVSISDYIDQPGKEKIDREVEVDGKLMYKASIVRQLFTGKVHQKTDYEGYKVCLDLLVHLKVM